MKAWGVTPDEIRQAARSVGLQVAQDWQGRGIVQDGRAWRFRLAVDSSQPRDDDGALPYQRVSTAPWNVNQRTGRPRRVAAVCWHGHRDFLRALFDVNPDARVRTALADYRGREGFEREYLSTFGQGNGYHVAYGQACACGSDVVRDIARAARAAA